MRNPIDFGIIGAYLVVIVGIGIASRGKQETAKDYFAAGGSMGGPIAVILVGLSITSSHLSGLSLLGIPSVAYLHGLKFLPVIVCFLGVWGVLHFWFLPRYLKTKYERPYDIVEENCGRSVRTTASVMFVLLRMGWLAALIYAPTLMTLTFLGLDQIWFWPVILIIGLSCTAYTVVGGIRGVIVTDAIQMLVILVGVAFVAGYVVMRLPVPLAEAVSSLKTSGHLDVADFTLSFTKPFTFWAVVVGWVVANLSSYMADQIALQRYLATGTVAAASRSFGINVIGAIVTLMLLILIGLLLRVWYQFTPDTHLPSEADRIFPYFVSQQLPAGLAGLLVAAILAATMGCMTGGINALAGSLTGDFVAKSDSGRSEQSALRYARLCSLAIGTLATVIAGFVGKLGTLFELQLRLMGVFLGPLLACMLISILTLRWRPFAVISGMVTGAAVGWILILVRIEGLWVNPAAFATTLLIAGSLARVSGKKSPGPSKGHTLPLLANRR